MHISVYLFIFAEEIITITSKSRKGNRNMITINEIVSEALKENENNVYYWDSLNDRAYHIHILTDGSYICFKQSPRRTEVISSEEFEEAVNKKCFGISIGEEGYYRSFKNIK